mgnify:CR=1 FL=1
MKEEINFAPGDILYYPDNLATAILLEYDWVEGSWTYSLRSPLGGDREGKHYLMLDCTKDELLQGAVQDGRFNHYPVKGST